MYKLIATISTLIRQFYMVNPFEVLGDGLIITIGDISMLLPPELLNWMAEPFMHTITFFVVGLYYDRGSAPVIGSLLYLLFYCVHTFILWGMSAVGFVSWVVVPIVVLYAVCIERLLVLKNRVHY